MVLRSGAKSKKSTKRRETKITCTGYNGCAATKKHTMRTQCVCRKGCNIIITCLTILLMYSKLLAIWSRMRSFAFYNIMGRWVYLQLQYTYTWIWCDVGRIYYYILYYCIVQKRSDHSDTVLLFYCVYIIYVYILYIYRRVSRETVKIIRQYSRSVAVYNRSQ